MINGVLDVKRIVDPVEEAVVAHHKEFVIVTSAGVSGCVTFTSGRRARNDMAGGT